MRVLNRSIVLCLLGFVAASVALIILAPRAGAHTAPVPVEISPAPGVELATAPSEVVLRFDGDFTDELEVALLDSTGAEVATSLQVDGRSVRLDVTEPESLPPDTYRISWFARTTHSEDAPDGVGAEARQTHFFVGNSSSGSVMSDESAGDSSSRGALVLVGLAAISVFGLAILAGLRGRRLVAASASIIVAGVVTAVVLASGDDADDRGGPWIGTLADETTVSLIADGGWDVRITDANGQATPYATAGQLRFTEPDGDASKLVDLSVDIDELGHLTAPPIGGVDEWETELVLSSFEGPVAMFVLPAR